MANIHTPIPNLKLNDGNSIPMLAFGLGTAWYKPSTGPTADHLDERCITAATTAQSLGYTHLDGAEVYGTEAELGAAIKKAALPREKLFITTKVLPNVEDIPGAIRASLGKLGLAFVDLYLIHYPIHLDDPAAHQARWAQMEEVQKQGLARSIGVSNYLPEHLEVLLQTCAVPPAINQIEFHPFLQHEELLRFHREKGIATAAYAPLTAITKASGKNAALDDLLAQLAHKYGVSPAEICLRWCVDQDVVAITTSGKEQRLSDYLRAMTFKLTPREVQMINEEGSKTHFRGFWNHKIAADDRR